MAQKVEPDQNKTDSNSSEMKLQRRILFVSTMGADPWGGSEILWHDTALHLIAEGHGVSASVCGWPKPAAQLSTLRKAGVVVNERWMTTDKLRPRSFRKMSRSLLDPLFRRASGYAFARWLNREKPDLICVSSGGIGDQQDLMSLCLASGMPFVVIVHCNGEQMWPDDANASKLIRIFQGARRMFFVSQRNRALLETQLGIEFATAEVVRNPSYVRRDAAPPWPVTSGPIRLACVGRLDPAAKGQDLVLHVLAKEPWKSRPVTVSFFGTGRSEQGLRRLAKRLGLADRTQFCGHVSDIERIWSTHHALVLPSRYEGLPVVIVEAMLCGRPVIVTDVAGHAEIVEDGVTGFIAEAPTVRHLDLAMERAWTNRLNWESMGKAAARSIREIMPADPAAVFARRLLELTGGESGSGR